MNLQIINDCAGTDIRLLTASTDTGWHYNEFELIASSYLPLQESIVHSVNTWVMFMSFLSNWVRALVW